MLVGCLLHTVCCKSLELKTKDRLPVNLSMELHVGNLEVYVIVLKLIEDVERSVVTCIGLGWVKGTRCIHCVAERVDIEVTADSSGNDIRRAGKSTRSLLVTVRTIGKQGNGKVL